MENRDELENENEMAVEDSVVFSQHPDSASSGSYLRGLGFNQAIRELFLHHFASLFLFYENFLLPSTTNSEEENSRDSMVKFDKASFLSDQPVILKKFLMEINGKLIFFTGQLFALFGRFFGDSGIFLAFSVFKTWKKKLIF